MYIIIAIDININRRGVYANNTNDPGCRTGRIGRQSS